MAMFVKLGKHRVRPDAVTRVVEERCGEACRIYTVDGREFSHEETALTTVARLEGKIY